MYSERLKADCYLIHYPQGASIPPHKDKVKDGNMYRLNIEIWKSKRGGKFRCNNVFSLFNRIYLFRPDIEKHSVTEVEEGSRWVFSIGKVFRRKHG